MNSKHQSGAGEPDAAPPAMCVRCNCNPATICEGCHQFAADGRTAPDVTRMVDRFLAWRLPEDFMPDAGISFTRDYNLNTPYPAKHEPTGTNLFTATQARAMVEHMLGGDGRTARAEEALSIARQAVNAWACSAKRNIDLVEISRLHQAIDGLAAQAIPAPPRGETEEKEKNE